jgi:hypothetical protein
LKGKDVSVDRLRNQLEGMRARHKPIRLVLLTANAVEANNPVVYSLVEYEDGNFAIHRNGELFDGEYTVSRYDHCLNRFFRLTDRAEQQ